MSVNQSDDASQRLNYFNGQRLAAGDFRTEQEYHLGMRRLLNRSLYSPGIVVGLEVEPVKPDPVKPDPADKHRVVVRRGLAFDHLGREIFLPTDMLVQVMGAPSSMDGVVFGNLLTISYRERRQFPSQEQCVIGAPFKPCSGDLPWGAPTRIVADAVFEFLDSWPTEESGRVVLGQIELSSKCDVTRVLAGVRKYAVPVKPPTVTPLALEGEKDIDANNPKELIFHVRGGFPAAATLVLQSRPFGSVHYTEMPPHTHQLNLVLSMQPGVAAHRHALGAIQTSDELDPANIGFTSLAHAGNEGDYCIRLWKPANYLKQGSLEDGDVPWDLGQKAGLRATNTLHHHAIAAGQETNDAGAVPDHTHTFTASTAAVVGQQPFGGGGGVRAGNAYSYFGDLKVELDGVNITENLLAQLKASGTDWPTLRLGAADDQTHVMVTTGTGDIDLLRLPGVDLVPGPHTLRFTPSSGGGQLHYNLYVE
jgi:hypothetical protein